MSDKNLCVNIGKSASETLALLTLACGEYAVKKLNNISGSRKSENMCKITQEVGSQKCKGRMQMWTEYGPWWT
jgi:hypothetical protein